MKAWNKKLLAPRLNSFPKITFSTWQFSIGLLHFSHNFSKRISNLRPNVTYNMMKTQMFLHQTLEYSQIYNFTLDHDYKFKIIIMLKNVWVSKSKIVYVFLFFWMFWTYGSFLVEYIKVQKKLKWFGEHLIKKGLSKQKNHLSTCFSQVFYTYKRILETWWIFMKIL